MLTRRGLLGAGFLIGIGSLLKIPQRSTVQLHRIFYFPVDANLEQISIDSQNYINYKELYFLDRSFQIKKHLLDVQYSQTGPNQTTTVRTFINHQACEQWLKLYNVNCLIKGKDPKAYSHHYEDLIVTV